MFFKFEFENNQEIDFLICLSSFKSIKKYLSFFLFFLFLFLLGILIVFNLGNKLSIDLNKIKLGFCFVIFFKLIKIFLNIFSEQVFLPFFNNIFINNFFILYSSYFSSIF